MVLRWKNTYRRTFIFSVMKEEKIERLRNEVEQKVPEVQAKMTMSETILHLKGMEEVVTKDEIDNAVVTRTIINRNLMEIRTLRTAFGGKLNVTVIVPHAETQTLIELGKMKIGWTIYVRLCKIIEIKRDFKCLRCLERERLCRKCGKDRHKVLQNSVVT